MDRQTWADREKTDGQLQTDRETDTQTDRRMDRQTDGQMDRQTDRQMDKLTSSNGLHIGASHNLSPPHPGVGADRNTPDWIRVEGRHPVPSVQVGGVGRDVATAAIDLVGDLVVQDDPIGLQRDAPVQ